MILHVNPNRMELLRLRKRLMLARRGHKLLQDKLEAMMRKFLALLRDIDKAKIDFEERMQSIIRDLLYSRIICSKDVFEQTLLKVESRIVINISIARIMNVKVPSFNVQELMIDKHYDFFRTSAQMDLAVAKAPDYVRSLLRLAQLLKTADILSYEIERTRRRVNALEYILIPLIEETIRYINQKLSEFERGNLVRLMRVKEVVRSH